MKIVDKIWGKEVWIHNDEKYCMKELHIKKGYQCSLHYHKLKTETFYVIKGSVELQFGVSEGIIREFLKPGNHSQINPGNKHRFAGLEDSIIIECSTQHFEDDSYRLEESCKINT